MAKTLVTGMRAIVVTLTLTWALASAAFAQGGPWIGVALEAGPKGAKVREVMADSPAQKAGLRPGEEVLSLDGAPTPRPDALIRLVRKAGVGQVVKLEVAGEDGKTRTVAVTLESRPDLDELQRGQLVGQRAPDFAPVGQVGPKLPRISALKGQVVLIDFFATWCGPCRAQMPHLEALHEKLGGKGLKVIGVSTEAAGVVRKAAARFGLRYTLVSDEDEAISRSYKVYALPTMVVIDRRGTVREVAVADLEAAGAAVRAALEGK